ncbi:hypothetical protein EYF80_022741 [Liparis tanakae]|uniref:Uncharacterized protein n=1 Tax=Liparis tanakae TaxID=230148 RepID=A0A4Z2HM87_9TELE|nr:hypothetical protein EYF80_022741 [Liparis tanakae]
MSISHDDVISHRERRGRWKPRAHRLLLPVHRDGHLWRPGDSYPGFLGSLSRLEPFSLRTSFSLLRRIDARNREEKRRHTGVRRQVKERGKETRSSDTVLLQQLQTLCEEEKKK